MNIDKKLIISLFEKFQDSYIYPNGNNGSIPLASFSFEIPSIQIHNLVTSNLVKKEDYFYWKIKDVDIEFLAFSPLVNFNKNGEDRLQLTSESVNNYNKLFFSNWKENQLDGIPIVVGGIKFASNQKSNLWSDFNDSDWFIPKFIFLNKDGKSFIIYNYVIGLPNDQVIAELNAIINSFNDLSAIETQDYSPSIISSKLETDSLEKWKIIVNKALENISNGFLSKVVLSREVKYHLHEYPNISSILLSLSEKYPKCYTFAFKRGESVFIGASPEKLAKINNRWIEVDALAGSAPRGQNEQEDTEMENYLLNSEKNLFEQRAVVNFIHNLLSKFSDKIIFDDKPVIRKLPNIQHLWTVLKARLNQDFDIFDLLYKLHPTPAICGDPWKVAQNFILEMEPHDRGLYSGNIGWFNFNGHGEIAVGIRSTLIKDDELFIYAGCGIVEGSEPNAEFEESEIKQKPILSLFSNEKIYQS